MTWVNANHVPVAVAPPTVWPADPTTGAVTVSPNIVHPDGDWLAFTLDVPLPQRGARTVDWDGTFTYVPFASERDDTTAGEETVGIRAVDSRGASAYVTVTVPISPRHMTAQPVLDSPMHDPDPETGVVTGTCGQDGGGCTYAISAAAKGTVMIDATTGAWAYRPSAEARHRAVADAASVTDRHDAFTVTVSDSNRNKRAVPVSVSLVPIKTVLSYAATAEIALGVVPVSLAVSQRGDRVFATSFVDGTALAVIRTADNAVSRIPLTFRPEGVVIGPDGRHLYVADPAGRRVAVVDTIENTTAFVGVGGRPFHMSFLGTDLYVANNQDGTISVIDTLGATAVRTIQVGGHPYAVAAARGRVFVTDYAFYGDQSTHRVSVIDAAQGKLDDTIRVGYYPTAIAVSPDGSRVYVTNDEGAYANAHPGTTTVINTTTGAVVDTLAVGGSAVAVSDNGDQVYIAGSGCGATSTSKLSIVELRTGRIDSVPLRGAPNALAVSGNRIFVTDTWHSSLIQVTARDTSVVDTVVANSPPKVTVTEVSLWVFRVKAEDPDNDQVSCTVTQPFCGPLNDLGDGLFQYTPNARTTEGFVDHFTVTADDGHGGVVTKTVALPV